MGSVLNGWRKQSGFGWFAYWHPERKVGLLVDSWLIVVLFYLDALNTQEAKEFELYFYERNFKGMKKVIEGVKR